MRALFHFVLIALCVLILSSNSVQADLPKQSPMTSSDTATAIIPPDPKVLMQKQDAMGRGYKDEKGAGRMQIFDASGKSIERSFEYTQLEATTTQGAKSLLRVTQPASLTGTGLLTWRNKGREDDQWVYLPSMKKTNRIVGSAKKGRFIGSDFSFEDLTPKATDDCTYTWVRSETCAETTCQVIQCAPKDKDSTYAKITIWVRDSDTQTIQTEMFDEKGQLVKRAHFEDRRLIGGKYFLPHKVTMEDVAKKTSSQLILDAVTVQNGLTDADFTRTALER
jgi:outer membrane lipoprotein-sorting protein